MKPIFLLFIGLGLLAEDSKPVAEQPKQIPTIADSTRAKFWRAQVQLVMLQPALDKANAEMSVVHKKMAEECGKDHVPIIGTSGEPECQAKPKEPEVKVPDKPGSQQKK